MIIFVKHFIHGMNHIEVVDGGVVERNIDNVQNGEMFD